VIGIILVVGPVVTPIGVLAWRFGLPSRLRLALWLGLPLNARFRFAPRGRVRRLLQYRSWRFGLAGGLGLPGAVVHAAIHGLPARGVGAHVPLGECRVLARGARHR
jgi:hypothetical protein